MMLELLCCDQTKPFMMEVAATNALGFQGRPFGEAGSRLLLRESAQCPKADLPQFQDIRKHRFFNTNNLWLRLESLRGLLKKTTALSRYP